MKGLEFLKPYKSAPYSKLAILDFIGYCETREDFNARDKYILWLAYLDYTNSWEQKQI